MNITDAALEQALETELKKGETLLWAGQLRKGIIFRGIDIFLIPFSMVWAGGASVGCFALVTAGPWFMIPVGLLFLSVSFYITIGRFLHDILKRKYTIYGITNERIIIRSGIVSKRIESHALSTLSNLSLDKGARGYGHIVFGEGGYRHHYFTRNSLTHIQIPGICDIKDAEVIYEIVLKARAVAR